MPGNCERTTDELPAWHSDGMITGARGTVPYLQIQKTIADAISVRVLDAAIRGCPYCVSSRQKTLCSQFNNTRTRRCKERRYEDNEEQISSE